MNEEVKNALKKLESLKNEVAQAETALFEEIKNAFPSGKIVFFDQNRGEASAEIVAVKGEYLYLDTNKGKKIHFSEARFYQKTDELSD
jgi:hypothetical protein